MSTVSPNNLIDASVEIRPGQRLIKINNTIYPVGIGGNYSPSSTGGGIDLEGVDVEPGHILEGVVAVNGAGEQITGNIPTTEPEVVGNSVIISYGYIPEDIEVLAGDDVRYGYVTADGKIQLMDMSGESPTEDGEPQDMDIYLIKTSSDEPEYGSQDLFTELMYDRVTEINSDFTTIRSYVFGGCENLVTVNMPQAVDVGACAFYSCDGLSSVNLPAAKTIGTKAFYNCANLTSIDISNATSIGEQALYKCAKLVEIDVSEVTTVGEGAFYQCSKLTSMRMPKLTTAAGDLFRYCYVLLTIDMGLITNIPAYCFRDCRRTTAIILRSPTLCTVENANAFTNCYHLSGTTNSTYNKNGLQDCYVYVPGNLVESYKTADIWSTYSTQFRAIEDYPEICG